MSTDHQQYSTENQHDAIQRFADARGIKIVRSFVDAGKSGVSIHGRDALQDLLRTVESGQAGFSTILVYDVSRWGRFQEPDEGAYYEFRCIRAGITVQYCAEHFPADNGPMSAVMKSMKRAMAGETSRDLSTKVFAGQCKLISLGYRQGGTPGYGLRRQLLDQHGQPKGILARGDRKSFQMDRVILTPGPELEVETVRRIYHLFTQSQLPESHIAKALNNEGRTAEAGRPWTRGIVHEILTNEKYIGNNLYNRTSTKLQTPRIANAPEQWVRRNGAYEAIIDAEVFAEVQRIMTMRDHHYTDDELLDRLRELFKRHGTLSGVIINETAGMPSTATYCHRFQNLRRAYELVGYQPERDYSFVETNKALRRFHQDQYASIVNSLEQAGASVQRDAGSDLLTINDEFTTSVILARCRPTPGAQHRWLLRLEDSLKPDITVAARLTPANDCILDYYIFPRIDVLFSRLLSEQNELSVDVYRFDDLNFFTGMASRAQIEAA